VGQLIARKNVANAIAAFAQIRQPDDTFTIVGGGELRDALQGHALSLGLADSVVFAGQKAGEALIEEYARANTLVLPSTNEVWGLVANEALAAGLHVVISDRCGATPDIRTMQGVYVAGTDSSSLAAAMVSSRSEWNGWITKPQILHSSFSIVDLMSRLGSL
jgi:glycosyltransferase involved in cell wall biosynthesis